MPVLVVAQISVQTPSRALCPSDWGTARVLGSVYTHNLRFPSSPPASPGCPGSFPWFLWPKRWEPFHQKVSCCHVPLDCGWPRAKPRKFALCCSLPPSFYSPPKMGLLLLTLQNPQIFVFLYFVQSLWLLSAGGSLCQEFNPSCRKWNHRNRF